MKYIYCNFLKLEILQHLRRYNDFTTPLWFLILITAVFSISFQQNNVLLQFAAPSIIWVSALLAILLSIHQLFMQDYQSGILEQMALSILPLPSIILIKIAAYWLKTCVPLLLLTPVIGLLLHLPAKQVPFILLSLVLGTPSLLFLGALSAALTLRLNHHALLLFLLVLPLSIPILIFGLSLATSGAESLNLAAPFCWLSALFLLNLCLMPFAISFALQIGIDH